MEPNPEGRTLNGNIARGVVVDLTPIFFLLVQYVCTYYYYLITSYYILLLRSTKDIYIYY